MPVNTSDYLLHSLGGWLFCSISMGKCGIILTSLRYFSLVTLNGTDFISLTDIARNKNPKEPKDVVKNWMRSKTTIEFLGLWEQLNNPEFKGVEFDSFLYEAGNNAFTLSPSR